MIIEISGSESVYFSPFGGHFVLCKLQGKKLKIQLGNRFFSNSACFNYAKSPVPHIYPKYTLMLTGGLFSEIRLNYNRGFRGWVIEWRLSSSIWIASINNKVRSFELLNDINEWHHSKRPDNNTGNINVKTVVLSLVWRWHHLNVENSKHSFVVFWY